MRRLLASAITLLLLSGNAAGAQAAADWLDDPLANWNQAGMPIPPPSGEPSNLAPYCGATLRWPETPQDQMLVDAGWSLQSPYRAGWGTVVVDAASGYDGMCRPLAYNAFVFQDGVFVGTISPDLMDSRTSGSGSVTTLQNGRVMARYLRYAPTDPLCCPSLPAVDVTFEIQSTPQGAVLAPVSSYA